MKYTYFVPPKTRKLEFKIQFLVFFAILLFMGSPILRVSADGGYSSWITGSSADNMYGGLAAENKVPEMENSEEDAHSHILLNFLIKLPDGITNALQGNSNSDYNFSIDGIILGRLASGTIVNYTGFDFGSNNPWSSIGAVVYRCLRNACLGLMLFAFYFVIAKTIPATGEAARKNLKESLTTLIFMFVLIYVMPQILDMLIYWRDYGLKLIHDGLYSSGIATSTSTSIIEEYRNMAINSMTLFNVLLYTGAAISTLWYLFSYIKIAMIQAMLFGVFPLLAVLSIFNRKLIHDWFWMFFGNALVPLFDFTILLMPVVVDNTVSTNGLLKALLKLSIIMCAIPARNAVLRLISMHSGLSVGGGFGAIAGLGAAAVGTGRSLAASAKSARGSLANRESDMYNSSDGNNYAEMSKDFGSDADKMTNLVDAASDQQGATSDGAGAGNDEAENAFEKSQEALEGVVADGSGEDETELTGRTDSEEPDVPEPEAETENEEFESEEDATGTPAHEELDMPAPDREETPAESVPNAAEDNSADQGNGQEPAGEPHNDLGENGNPGDGNVDHPGSETAVAENDAANTVAAADNGAGHGVNAEGAGQGTDQTGTTTKATLPQVEGRDDDRHQASLKEYGESEKLAKFNDARFKNLENLDAANSRMSGLKSQGAKLESDRSTKATAYAEAKENLNAVNRETSSAVRDANHNVETASNNLQKAQREQITATEKVAALDKNASREQRAVADARLQMANQNMAKAQESYDKAKEAQTAAQKNQTERVAQATQNVNEHRQSLNDATKRVEDNSHAQRVENARITQAKQYEDKFRNMAQSYGMSSRGYANADDFKRQRTVDGRMRALANYKNFDSANFRNVLSPEERSQFQRERELHVARSKRIEQTRSIMTGDVAGAVNSAETVAGKVAAGTAAEGAKVVHAAAKGAAFVGGGVVGSFGGAAGAVVVGGMAARAAGAGNATVNATANVLQAANQAEPKKPKETTPDPSYAGNQRGSTATQQTRPARRNGQGTGKQPSGRKIITDNARNAGSDPEINNILK